MIDVLIPETATILQWLKGEGDEVAEGDILLEIETDKTVLEVEASGSGRLSRILVEAGTAGVEVGTKIALIGSPDSAHEPVAPAAAPSPIAAPPPVSPPTPVASTSPIASPVLVTAAPDMGERIAMSPFARKLADEASLDVREIAGTGPGNRIVGRDVRAHLASATVPAQEAEHAGSYDTLPIDGMRRTIAQRLSESASTVPHFYLSCNFRLDALLALRTQLNHELETFAQTTGTERIKLSINDFFIKAIAAALHHRPDANVIWEGDSIRRFKQVDVGMAVAMDGGLITPVLRDVHHKSLGALAAEARDMASRARTRRLDKTEYSGGATTVSNLGMYGTERFTAIINPPQSSIFAIGAVRQEVVVCNDAPKVAWVSTVTLSCDHRVIDGAAAAQLLDMVRQFIETPTLLSV